MKKLTSEQLVRELATLRDSLAGNELCKHDPEGMLMLFIMQARLTLGMPEWESPMPASPLLNAALDRLGKAGH